MLDSVDVNKERKNNMYNKKVSTMKKIIFTLMLLPMTIYAKGFYVTSHDVKGQLSQQQVFSGFGCNGHNISPQISWHNAPKQSKSFAVTMYDPDAPTGMGWMHWVIFNIPKKAHQLKTNAGNIKKHIAPHQSIQSFNSFV